MNNQSSVQLYCTGGTVLRTVSYGLNQQAAREQTATVQYSTVTIEYSNYQTVKNMLMPCANVVVHLEFKVGHSSQVRLRMAAT